MSKSTVQSLFQTAVEEGDMTPGSMKVLQVADIGASIQDALGVPADQFTKSEVVLVSMMPDDSGSIRFVQGNTEAVRDGHNLVLDALKATKQKDGILVMNRYLNGELLYPYSSLEQAIKMDSRNYNPNQGTPLYDQTVVLLGAVLAKCQEFMDNGIAVRTVTLILTDGADEHSVRHTAADVKKVVDDMLRQERHIIAAMGIDDGITKFRQVFSAMGIRDEWILTPGKSPHEIRAAFQTFSQSAVRASQGGASFSQTAMGGFGA